MEKKVKIAFKKRSEDYISYLEENSAFWGCGKTPVAAIGDLIFSHPEKFNIQITEAIEFNNK